MAQITHFMYGTSSTYRADAFTSASATNVKEGQITAAIAAAVADGVQAVFVPQSMLPYNASLVSFNTAVQMLRESGPSDVFDVAAYGADPANTNAANIASFNAAIAGAAASTRTPKTVWVPARIIPYGAYGASVTFNTAVRMIREGSDPSEFDVEAYGATPSGAAFSMVSIQAALDAQNAYGSGVVRMPGAAYYVNTTLFYYSNTILRGNGASFNGVGGTQIIQSSGSTTVLSPKTPGTRTQGFIFEDFAINVQSATSAGAIDCTNCLAFTIRNVLIGSPNAFGIRVVGGTTAGDAGFGNLIGVTIENPRANAYGFQFSGSANDQPDGMSMTDCYVTATGVGTWIKYDAVNGSHVCTSHSWKGCRFEASGGSALVDITVDANGAGPLWFTNCRFENTGTGGVQFTLRGPNNLGQCAQFRGCSVAPGSGTFTLVDSGPVLSDFLGHLGASNIILNQFGTAVQDATVPLASGATPAVNAATGNRFTLAILTNIAVTIGIPTNAPPAGRTQEIVIVIRNQSGGVLTTPPTFNTGAGGFKFSAVTNPANGTQVEYKFRWDPVQSFWYEVGTHLAAGL